MDHKNIKGKLLLYIDSELSCREMIEVKAHIDICPDCWKHITELSALWKLDEAEKLKVPQYIWKSLETEIKEHEQNPVPFDIFCFRNKFGFILQPAVIAGIFFISVLTGYFGGNILSKEINRNQAISNKEQFAEAFYLDRLETENISSVLIVASNENKERHYGE